METKKTITSYKQGLKDKILETAMHAFATQGIKAVRMDDIAQTLGISKRTLYELYENKEVLLYEGVKLFKARKEAELQHLSAESRNVMDVVLQTYRIKVLEFRKVNTNFYSDMSKYPSVKQLLEQDTKARHQRTLAFFRRGVAEGYFCSGVDYVLAVRMFDAMGEYVMSNELYKQYTLEYILNNLIFVTFRGLCTQKGLEVLDTFMQEDHFNVDL